MSGQAVVKRAVLLAAGRGTRLRPHTDTTPKPLLVHKGKPTLDYLLIPQYHWLDLSFVGLGIQFYRHQY